ncbi:hypothetical protein GRI97_11035 [Altererythrobacter xixiisoli]|uniref:Toxic anion resistance protein (TelA) n=1 Tax=Croceibacterium xixiisoli TaxID=1476466 RepID=A0A6I4TUQ4_9SPHN|nr:toxic anion resistance protein [Croceibacterium xixiisoli]MXO99522.1 hypothetical protein [Croceibacterium xixiisoli]
MSDPAAMARQLLRQWLNSPDEEVLRSIDLLGRAAIRAAANATVRLSRSSDSSAPAGGVLAELEAFAASFSGDPAPRRRSWFGARPAPEPSPPNLNTLVERLERERDAIAHRMIVLAADRDKLQESQADLDQALELIRRLGTVVAAGVRELAHDQPGRSAFLDQTVTPALLVREQDVLTQQTVTNQGVLALQLVEEGQRVLGQSLERACETTIAVLRTAIATRQAVAGHRDLLEQADALDRSAQAAREALGSHRDAERALADAVEQVRRAVDATQSRSAAF